MGTLERGITQYRRHEGENGKNRKKPLTERGKESNTQRYLGKKDKKLEDL